LRVRAESRLCVGLSVWGLSVHVDQLSEITIGSSISAARPTNRVDRLAFFGLDCDAFFAI